MNRIIFLAAATVGLAAVAGGSCKEQPKVESACLPSVAVQVEDEALKAVRRYGLNNDLPAI